ncbi:MAG: hypothetical protein QM680_02070 [Luteolibacter sp.]
MKNLALIATLIAVSLGFSSCCSMFGSHERYAGYRTVTKKVKTCGYETITEEVYTGGKGGMTETVEKKVPRYKTITKKIPVKGGPCVQLYCPKKTTCGSTAEGTLKIASAQGSVGSPNIGLVPSMKPLAP